MTRYFEKWVERMTKSYFEKNDDYDAYYKGNVSVVVVNLNTGKTGIAKCHKDDKYDWKIGLAIAYARCIGKPVPDFDFIPKKALKFHLFCYNKKTATLLCDEKFTYDEILASNYLNHCEKVQFENFPIEKYSFVKQSSSYITVISLIE